MSLSYLPDRCFKNIKIDSYAELCRQYGNKNVSFTQDHYPDLPEGISPVRCYYWHEGMLLEAGGVKFVRRR